MDLSLLIPAITGIFSSYVSYHIAKVQAQKVASTEPPKTEEVAQGEKLYELVKQEAQKESDALVVIETFDRQPSTLMRPSIEGFLQQLLQQPEFLERVQATLGTALDSTTGSGNVINASSTVYGPQVVRNNGGSTINYTYNPDSSTPKD